MNFQLGITQEFPCSYLPNQKERLLVATDPRLHDKAHYSWLMSQGFRRSGDQIYRPHCQQCSACQSLRVLTKAFTPSKSQKRLLKRNSAFVIKVSDSLQAHYYDLYELYINIIHTDGAMYPASYDQYENFLKTDAFEQIFIEIYDGDELISVATTDVLNNALSAVYTFYHPDYRKQSLGMYSILCQIEIAMQIGKDYLYLGYQIDECRKMNYKNQFYPHEILSENSWHLINK